MGKIRYSLRENPFVRSGDNQYIAAVRKGENYDQADLIELMDRRNTSLTRQDITAVLSLMNEVMADEVMAGNRIGTDLFKAFVSIKGGFRTVDEKFDRKKHPVCVHVNPTRIFRKMVYQKAKVRRVDPLGHAPVIYGFYDYASRSHRDKLSAGGLVNLKGDELLCQGKVIGLFLKPEGVVARYPIPMIHEITNRNILFTLPGDLVEGSYRLIAEMSEGSYFYTVGYDNIISIVDSSEVANPHESAPDSKKISP